ncbi:MAG: DUF3499 domain-containing protein [Ruaniaceae bacterium]|nr:DUF3499 domain-containing protein [Ruaniaceae bacterium]
MKMRRQCSRSACVRPAVATLTYDYDDSTAVLGPLSLQAEPHAYDLCEVHAERLTVPRGWQVVRLATEFEPAPPSPDDLLALAEAVREASRFVPQRVTGLRAEPAPVTHEVAPTGRPTFEIVKGGLDA